MQAQLKQLRRVYVGLFFLQGFISVFWFSSQIYPHASLPKSI